LEKIFVDKSSTRADLINEMFKAEEFARLGAGGSRPFTAEQEALIEYRSSQADGRLG
jgi:hypothetical protein